jgi:hypothetical protein
MVMIVQFEGVIGDIKRRNLSDDTFQLMLRHGAIEGMRELIKSFQVVLFTKLSEKTIKLVVEHFIKHDKLLFDGVYCKEPNDGVFANYN